eukprot:38337-Chlamydomonas_euryale.AAC.9
MHGRAPVCLCSKPRVQLRRCACCMRPCVAALPEKGRSQRCCLSPFVRCPTSSQEAAHTNAGGWKLAFLLEISPNDRDCTVLFHNKHKAPPRLIATALRAHQFAVGAGYASQT